MSEWGGRGERRVIREKREREKEGERDQRRGNDFLHGAGISTREVRVGGRGREGKKEGLFAFASCP